MIEHKHLILKGTMAQSLKKGDVHNLLNDMVEVLGMELIQGVRTNPNVGYEGGDYPGVTGCALITTSHIVLHTWDKTMDFQFDCYSCKDFNPDDVIAELITWGLNAEHKKYFDREYKIIEIDNE